jgi:outer membrane protein TolC
LEPAERLVVVPTRLSLDESWELGVRRRPDLAQAILDVEKARIEQAYRHNQLFPSLDLVAGYGRRGASAVQTLPPFPGGHASLEEAWDEIERGDAPRHALGLVLSVPLSRAAERGQYRAQKHLREQAELRVKQKEEWILREISDAIYNAESALNRATATRRSREAAQAALAAEEQKLARGHSTLFFVFELQGNVVDAEAADARARADYNQALSQLHFSEGSLARKYDLEFAVD